MRVVPAWQGGVSCTAGDAGSGEGHKAVAWLGLAAACPAGQPHAGRSPGLFDTPSAAELGWQPPCDPCNSVASILRGRPLANYYCKMAAYVRMEHAACLTAMLHILDSNICLA
jgi:hypothetical protein